MQGYRTVVVALGLAMTLTSIPPVQAASTRGNYVQSAHESTNTMRTERDRTRLAKSTCLQTFAVRQAAKMAARESLFHQDLGVILRRCGLGNVGENVAFGYPTGRAVVTGWMHSAPHRANILNRRYRLMGIGASRGGDGSWYVAQVFGRKR